MYKKHFTNQEHFSLAVYKYRIRKAIESTELPHTNLRGYECGTKVMKGRRERAHIEPYHVGNSTVLAIIRESTHKDHNTLDVQIASLSESEVEQIFWNFHKKFM